MCFHLSTNVTNFLESYLSLLAAVMSQENSDKSIPTISPETGTGDVDPPTVSSEEPANAGYEYYVETEPAAEAEIYYYDEENVSEEQSKPSSTHTQPPLPPTPPKRESGSIPAAPMEVTTTAQHTGWFVAHHVLCSYSQ